MHAFLHILNPSVLYHQQVPDDVRQLAGLLLKNNVLRHAQPFVLGEIKGGGGGAVQQGAELRDYVKHQVRTSSEPIHQTTCPLNQTHPKTPMPP